MINDQEQKKPLIERLRQSYRLVIMNKETFQEISSYNLTLLNVYVLLSTVVVVVAIAVASLIAFTPLRRYLPGYGEGGHAYSEINNLNRQLAELEKELTIQRSYSENFRKILVGNIEELKEEPVSEATEADSFTDSVGMVERIPEDEQLRRESEIERIRESGGDIRVTNLSPRDQPLEQMYFIPPVTGEISAGFDANKNHLGVDILAPKNTAIKAAMDGFVFLSDWTIETGNTIGIQHSNNAITFYKHNSALLKKAGSFVRAGEAVAIIGNTGTLSSGPHLHFELWYKGKAVNPNDYISF